MPRKAKKASTQGSCALSMRVSLKPVDGAEWRELEAGSLVAAGDQIEIVVSTQCKALIDIKPDNSTPIETVRWVNIFFAPPRAVCTRVKVAYYCAAAVSRRTNVTFFVTAQCAQCADCDGMDMQELALIFQPNSGGGR